jgi:hypothetical protein
VDSDKGTSDEIWSLSAKETLRRALVGTEKVESTSELELLRKQIEEFATMKREMSKELKELREMKQSTELSSEMQKYKEDDFAVQCFDIITT